MTLRYRLAVESSHVLRRSKRLLRLLVSKDFRTRNEYYRARMQVTTDTWLRHVESGERNPAFEAPGADKDTLDPFTPAAVAKYHLESALADAGLTRQFLDYSQRRGYKEGIREAGYHLEKDMATLRECIVNARLNHISLEAHIDQHPWARFYLTS